MNPFSKKFYLPPKFKFKPQYMEFICSSFKKESRLERASFWIHYFNSFLIILYKILRRIKYLIETAKIEALTSNGVVLWKVIYEIINFHPEIAKIQLKMRKGSPLVGSNQFRRLYEIEKLLQKFSPSSILEYGSGTSSAMFAKLLEKKGFFKTIDQMPEWRQKLLDILPDNLKKKISSELAKTKIHEVDSEFVIAYDFPHDRYFDFIYVDGPASTKTMANYDIELLWKNNIFPKFIVIDGRYSTVRRLILNGRKKYNIYLRSDLMCKIDPNNFFNLCNSLYHTILVRKDVVI